MKKKQNLTIQAAYIVNFPNVDRVRSMMAFPDISGKRLWRQSNSTSGYIYI
jgi:hypothetical protein